MHLHAPVPRGWNIRHGLRPRAQANTNDGGPDSTVIFIVIASITGAIALAALGIFIYRKNQAKTPTGTKKSGVFGRITGRLRGGQYEQTPGEDGGEGGRQSHQLDNTNSQRNNGSASADQTNSNTTATVDRNTSVRSVLTLPAYRQMANINEQVLGREGERDGVDVIVDLPTAEEDEETRNEEMETLYQIRLARRQMLAEREQRREQRRQARTRNDFRTLEQLRADTRAANEDTTITDLRQTVDQIKENRQRSVSSVSYADVGIARHDGTRIRANSNESERVGLLSDAASLGHQRGRSASSAASHDDEFQSLTPAQSRGDSHSGASTLSVDGRAGSSPELVEADLGEGTMPPPEYEDIPLTDDRSTTPSHGPPPDYPGPYRTASQRTAERDLGSERHGPEAEAEAAEQAGGDGNDNNSKNNGSTSGRGVGGVPQLPSLRISRLPEIVIEPSSAHPRDNDLRSPR
ncbi:hypothetical protein FZEAL_8389 [Fusarium zealandicum]|uniref:Uncharacterized protein n=1 Tax=Fusarium zealandicum TaxID=1053134 RepID=A0A8H4XHV9_9HYPO|nr:hypothetical protein FZEAL_8389 [Fusarium zealandicum]